MTRKQDSVKISWAFVDDFIRRWLDPDYERPVPFEQITGIEDDLQLCLPDSVREWYAFANAAQTGHHCFGLRDCLILGRMKAFSAITILQAGEDDVYWSIDLCDWTQQDPPVVEYSIFDPADEGSQDVFYPWGVRAPSTAAFALEYLLAYLNVPGPQFNLSKTDVEASGSSFCQEFDTMVEFGHMKLFYCGDAVACTSLMPYSWFFGQVKVVFPRGKPDKIPRSVEELMSKKRLGVLCWLGWTIL